ncbi:carbonic anhydrase-like [Tachypleus tridentatus]|uniref:carbonic anhydrase-like n=1 Tax=Tachypleus tridentatus TaxID=6853 RepID=UPI003FD005BB
MASCPSFCSELFPQCDRGTQSPIDLTMRHLKLDGLKFVDYDLKLNFITLKNIGKTVKVTFDSPDTPMLQDEVDNAEYVSDRFHFHWGKVDTRGSEHTVEQTAYPLELHLVHYNSKYCHLKEALAHEDGIAVVRMLFKLNEDSAHNLDDVTDALESVENKGDTYTVNDLDVKLSDLLPSDTSVYFRYEGSLTTPMCNAATWNVYVGKTISPSQLEDFRSLKDGDDNYLVDNFRPIQL